MPIRVKVRDEADGKVTVRDLVDAREMVANDPRYTIVNEAAAIAEQTAVRPKPPVPGGRR